MLSRPEKFYGGSHPSSLGERLPLPPPPASGRSLVSSPLLRDAKSAGPARWRRVPALEPGAEQNTQRTPAGWEAPSCKPDLNRDSPFNRGADRSICQMAQLLSRAPVRSGPRGSTCSAAAPQGPVACQPSRSGLAVGASSEGERRKIPNPAASSWQPAHPITTKLSVPPQYFSWVLTG